MRTCYYVEYKIGYRRSPVPPRPCDDYIVADSVEELDATLRERVHHMGYALLGYTYRQATEEEEQEYYYEIQCEEQAYLDSLDFTGQWW